jgi:hypothetical protein
MSYTSLVCTFVTLTCFLSTPSVLDVKDMLGMLEKRSVFIATSGDIVNGISSFAYSRLTDEMVFIDPS